MDHYASRASHAVTMEDLQRLLERTLQHLVELEVHNIALLDRIEALEKAHRDRAKLPFFQGT